MSISHLDASDLLARWSEPMSDHSVPFRSIRYPSIEDMRAIYVARRTLKMMAEWKRRTDLGRRQIVECAELMDRMMESAMDGDKIRDGAAIHLSHDEIVVLRRGSVLLLEYAIAAEEEAGKKKSWKGR